MSIIGSFSNKVFQVSSNNLYTFDDFSITGDLSIDEQEVDGSKPSTYIKGSGLEKVSFSVSIIKQNNINVRYEIDDWFKIMNTKIPHHLIIGSKNISSSKFLLTNVNVSETKIGINGEFLKAIVQLQFSEYVRAGKKEENSTATVSASTSTTSKSVSKPSTSKTSKKTKKRSSKKSTKKTSSSKQNNSKVQALEKELYG